jgi:hypothetical protein
MAIVTPRRREIELVKEAAERVAHRTRSKFVWNDQLPPATAEYTVDDRQANEPMDRSPMHFK